MVGRFEHGELRHRDKAVGAFILSYAIRYKRILPLVLALVQIIIAIWLETSVMHEVGFSTQLRIDELSIIMALIIGTVGTGICVYALGYMKDFQSHHADQKDRRPWFFALMFVFLSAMYDIVFSNNMCGSTRLGKSPRCARSCLSASRRPTRPSATHFARSS